MCRGEPRPTVCIAPSLEEALIGRFENRSYGAVGASPFISTIVDALSLLVYFLFAKALLGV